MASSALEDVSKFVKIQRQAEGLTHSHLTSLMAGMMCSAQNTCSCHIARVHRCHRRCSPSGCARNKSKEGTGTAHTQPIDGHASETQPRPSDRWPRSLSCTLQTLSTSIFSPFLTAPTVGESSSSVDEIWVPSREARKGP